jgi:outer membrane protein assembly complex protein YaeT
MRTAAGLLVCVALAASAAAQEGAAKYIGRRIAEVRVLSEGASLTDQSVAGLVATRVGQPLSMADVRETITHLFSLGRFGDVQVEALDAPDGGVRLQYRLAPLHNVERVDFTGQLGVSEGLLRRAVTDRFGVSPPVSRAADVARALQQVYADHGYYHATVRPVATERHDPDRTLLDFDISAGPRAVISGVEIEGDPLMPRATFLDRIDAVPGATYERTAVEEKLRDYVQRLRQRGRYRAEGTARADVSPDGSSARLTVEIHAGPPVTVRFEGDTVPSDKLQNLVPIQREASVEEDLLEDSVQRITAFLSQQGYWKASVAYALHDAPEQLAVVFTIRKGLLYRVSDEGVALRGSKAIPVEELRPLVKIVPRELFVSTRLDAATAAVADFYRRRGFAAVKVESAANELNPVRSGEGVVQPAVVITEGPQTRIGDVRIAGNATVAETELRSVISVKTGNEFYEPQLVADRDAVFARYLDEGFASAAVQVVPAFSPDRTRADLTFQIAEGPRTIVDHVLIVGNTHTDTRVIERELTIKPDRPLGASDLAESRRRLSALGLFRRIQITPLSHGSENRRDVLITVEEAPATSVDFGGGLEASKRLRTGADQRAEERYELAPRGFFDIGRRNIGGRNRTINLYTRVSLRPRDASQDPERDGTGFGFSEYRVVTTYRQPRLLGPNDTTVTAAIEKGIRASFNFVRKGVNVESFRRLSPSLRANARYSFNTTRRFDERLSPEEKALIDRVFPHVRLSVFSGAVAHDTRDDLLEPSKGTFASAEGSIAARSLGGQVGFVKTYLQGFWFRRLPGGRRVIFATRAAVGLADGFPRTVACTDEPGNPATCTVEDLPASERFFAGGDTTIRGFAPDRVGIPPKGTSQADLDRATIGASGFPKGGNAVLILNGEFRIPIGRRLGAALFVDGGNVFNRVMDFSAREIRGAAGVGLRYRSPIGPVRVDVGFKMDRRVIGGKLEPGHAFHISVGQAF